MTWEQYVPPGRRRPAATPAPRQPAGASGQQALTEWGPRLQQQWGQLESRRTQAKEQRPVILAERRAEQERKAAQQQRAQERKIADRQRELDLWGTGLQARANRSELARQEYLGPAEGESERQFEARLDPLRTQDREFSERLAELRVPVSQVPRPAKPAAAAELTPAQRDARLGLAYEMSLEDFNALSDRQKAAVHFNTGMVAAARKDAEAGTTQATEEYLSRLGITTRGEDDLNAFLQLDRLIGDSILAKLTDESIGERAKTGTHGRFHDEAMATEAAALSNARAVAEQAGKALAAQLSTTGLRRFDAPEPETRQLGFGTSDADQVVQQTYMNMIDSAFDLSSDDVAQGLAQLNESYGTRVTPQEVWDFLGAQLDAAAMSGAKRISAPAQTPDGFELKPHDIAEIRRRYGF